MIKDGDKIDYTIRLVTGANSEKRGVVDRTIFNTTDNLPLPVLMNNLFEKYVDSGQIISILFKF